MKSERTTKRIAFRTLLKWSLLLMCAFTFAMLTGCGSEIQQNGKLKASDSIITIAKTETYQELGFFGNIKEDQWNSLLSAVQNNIANSRKEQGNISFSLYQPENGKLQPIWFERFENKHAHDQHMDQNYFKDAIKVIKRSLEGEAKSIALKEVEKIPAAVPKLSDEPDMTRHLIVLLNVKPGKRQAFLGTMIGVASQSRQASGNLEFNIYQFADDPNKFVLVEGWASIDDHETHLKQSYIKELDVVTKDFFVTSPMDNRWMVKDISVESRAK